MSPLRLLIATLTYLILFLCEQDPYPLLLLFLSFPSQKAMAERPNILLIVADGELHLS